MIAITELADDYIVNQSVVELKKRKGKRRKEIKNKGRKKIIPAAVPVRPLENVRFPTTAI